MLAAGSSRRFGSDKRCYLLDGEPLLAHCLRAATEAELTVRVCCAPGETSLMQSLAPMPCEAIECNESDRGMGATLAQGIAACADWDALLVVLGDMAWVRPATYRTMFSALASAEIAQPCTGGRPGQPVGFRASFYPELMQLHADTGGRELLQKYRDVLVSVEVGDPGIHRDLDRPPTANSVQ
ncbi:MAG: nucleotidyltransferase family protein [Pseudomonadota bacterium]